MCLIYQLFFALKNTRVVIDFLFERFKTQNINERWTRRVLRIIVILRVVRFQKVNMAKSEITNL